MTTTSEHTGTTRYLAPELVSSEENVPPTTESDVYALGCLGLEVGHAVAIFSSSEFHQVLTTFYSSYMIRNPIQIAQTTCVGKLFVISSAMYLLQLAHRLKAGLAGMPGL